MSLPLALLALAAAPSAGGTPARAVDGLASYMSDDDYPREAIRNGEQGTVGFRLDVSASGSVTKCTVTATSGSRLLDETTCRILTERPRFAPARNRRGVAVAGTVSERVRWALPEGPPGPVPSQDMLRAVNNVWEVTAAGRERSCRRELVFETGDRINLDVCLPLDGKFLAAAAAYLGARPEEILTVRLENRWLIDPVLPFTPTPAHRGELLVRGEGDYRLNGDLSVRDCSEGRFTARFNWKPKPCFRTGFAAQVPAGTTGLRMEVQWVVGRGPDTERPSPLPSFASADGKVVIPLFDRQAEGERGAGPAGEPAPPPP